MPQRINKAQLQVVDKKAEWAALACQALLHEVNLTPKPGLVDRANNGAHRDMTLQHFYRSTEAIAPWFSRFMAEGETSCQQPAVEVLRRLRPLGMDCESDMFSATGGVNTHKGTVFSMGLLCCGLGRLHRLGRAITATSLCQQVALFCQGMVEKELSRLPAPPLQTAGQRLFHLHGLTGARGEAQSGFATVLNLSLPFYQRLMAQGSGQEHALSQTLLVLMSLNADTNVVSRGGMAGLMWLQARACEVLRQCQQRSAIPLLQDFDKQCITRNLSPGGSADLLILTWFLAQFPE